MRAASLARPYSSVRSYRSTIANLKNSFRSLQLLCGPGSSGRHEKRETVDVVITVHGGGTTGQADACKLGIARALKEYDPECEPVLREKNLLTRDAREVERKKYGLRKARRAPQFSKR